MFRRHLLIAAATLAALTAGAQPALAGPEGPRLTITARGDFQGYFGPRLITVGPAGEQPQDLVGATLRDVFVAGERPSWSADGSSLAFRVVKLGLKEHVAAVADADGGDLRAFPRAILVESDPVMAPDGTSVAFPRVRLARERPGSENYLLTSSVWLLDVEKRSLKRVTPWLLSRFLAPSSFSPDGSMLAASSWSRQGLTAVAIDVRTGRTSLLAREAMEPTYSPDGSNFAFVRPKTWRLSGADKPAPSIDELRVGRVGAVTPTRLLLRRRGMIAWPSWDPSGQRLAFTHSGLEESGNRSPEEGDRVMAINADGSCLTKVFSDPELTLYGSAWQPGPGREAGPISC